MTTDGRVYPYEDDLGFTWVDPITFLADREGLCFICKGKTKRLDVCYDGYYCGSDACDEEIRKDLEKYDYKEECCE
jgi:hypothetical protein